MLLTKKIFVRKFKTKEESQEKSEEKSEELKEYINNTLTFIEEESIVKYFNFLKPIDLANKLYEKKDAKKKQKTELVEEIKNRWSN